MNKVETITPEQKVTVQSSFELLQPVWEEAAALFYKRLFELNPALRPMFKVSMVEQQQKFMDMLRLAVYGLDYPDQLIPAVKRLGKRHIEYGVRPEDYATVGTALLWMLEEGLEGSFTPPMKEAWQVTYAVLTEMMLDLD